MITVTDLVSYIHCPRKLYAKKRLGYREPKTRKMLFGTIVHEMVEVVVREEVAILKRSRSFSSKAIHDALMSALARNFSKVLLKHRAMIKQFDQNPMEVYKRARKVVDGFVHDRAQKMSAYLTKADDPIKSVTRLPRVFPEFDVMSAQLDVRGRIDLLEQDGDFWVPIEFKTGESPKENVWKGHQMQVAAYALMLEQSGKTVKRGVVHYLSQNIKREVMFNPFMKREVRMLSKKVHSLIGQPSAPKGCGECEVCTVLH